MASERVCGWRATALLTAGLVMGQLGSGVASIAGMPVFAAGPGRAQAQTVAEAEALMTSGDRDEVEAGIQTLGLVGTAEAVAPLVARIRAGLPPELLETAIITLMALGQPQAGALLFELLSHRRPEIRAQVVEALAVLQPDGAADGLVSALSDSDQKVRDAAAQALGEIGATAAVPKLFLALDKGNMHASAAIGKLMAPSEVPRLSSYLGKVPLRSLRPALAEVLTRKDVDEKTKLRFVGQVQELATPGVRDFFQDMLASEADKLSPKVKRAIAAAIQGIAR